MAYVQVNIVTPNGNKYRSKVDEQVDYNELLNALVKDLELPVASSPSVDYELAISGAVKLTDGATIHILTRHPHAELSRNKQIVLVE
ncbi:MAG: hypothetical protein JMDDDDMK_03687 [Acidobacteria bacterium]|nr:hypothetical protein [Acidobacteriota bacterium]